MKSVPRWVKVLMAIGGVFIAIVLLWFAVRAIFPLPVRNGIEITEREIVIDTFEIPKSEYVQFYDYFTELTSGNYLYAINFDYYINSFAGNEEKDDTSRFYILSEDFKILHSIDNDWSFGNVFALENGNFSAVKRIKDSDDKYHDYLVEYSSELKVISEKAVPDAVQSDRLGNFNNDSFYYAGLGDDLHILDEDLNIVKTFTQADFPGSMFLNFAESYDEKPYLIISYLEDYEFPSSFIMRQIGSSGELTGEEVQLSLAPDTMIDLMGIHPGDENYDFYSTSSFLNETLNNIFLDNVGGNYLYGINEDGSFKKLDSVFTNENNSSVLDYYYGVPIGGKRYNGDVDEEIATGTVTVKLYEYTATYN
ncbi:MAG: hypothetical protein LBM59_02250 [Ruminococcus sp.]|jgi:hypothetical protein|nr:hypothetical protein [Ruminococcus sp.]